MRSPLSRDAIVETSWRILLEEGTEAVSLRRVAAALDVTAPALYAHIDDKEDLLDAVAELEFEHLLGRYRERRHDDPIDQLRYQLRQYVDYAVERPRAFQLLFRYRADVVGEGSAFPRHPAADELFRETTEPIAEAIERGIFRQVDPVVASLSIWAAVHGLATALLIGIDLDERRDPVIETTIEMIIEGMRAP